MGTWGSNTLTLTKNYPKYCDMTPRCPFIGFPQTILIDIEDIASRVDPNVVLWLLWVTKWPKL